MWELDYKESWAPKNCCFWTVVLEKTLEVPWTARRSNHSILKEISPGCALEGLMLKLKLQYFGHLMWRALIWKDPDAGRDWGQEEKGTTEDEMVGWHHRLSGHEFEQAPGVGDGQRAWHAAVHGVTRNQTWLSDWTELNCGLIIALWRSKNSFALHFMSKATGLWWSRIFLVKKWLSFAHFSA